MRGTMADEYTETLYKRNAIMLRRASRTAALLRTVLFVPGEHDNSRAPDVEKTRWRRVRVRVQCVLDNGISHRNDLFLIA